MAAIITNHYPAAVCSGATVQPLPSSACYLLQQPGLVRGNLGWSSYFACFTCCTIIIELCSSVLFISHKLHILLSAVKKIVNGVKGVLKIENIKFK